jgi:hypothetical protein
LTTQFPTAPRRGLILRLGVVLALAGSLLIGPSLASAGMTSGKAERTMRHKMSQKYGNEFTGATHRWLSCPKEEIWTYQGKTTSLCMSEFGSGKTRRYVQAPVDNHKRVKIYADQHYRRHWHRCAAHYVKGRVKANYFGCSGSAQQSYDLYYLVKRHKVPKHPVTYWHGTNLAGFDPIAKFPCKRQRHGHRWSFTCKNSLGDAFKYRVKAP